MRLVIDTSAIISVITNEPNKAAIIKATRGAELISPSSVHWEIANAFSAMLKQHRVALADAQRAISVYLEIPLRLVDVELDEVISISSQFNIYAYDACLIRCSQKYNAPLLTLDKGLLRAAAEARLQIMEVTK